MPTMMAPVPAVPIGIGFIIFPPVPIGPVMPPAPPAPPVPVVVVAPAPALPAGPVIPLPADPVAVPPVPAVSVPHAAVTVANAKTRRIERQVGDMWGSLRPDSGRHADRG